MNDLDLELYLKKYRGTVFATAFFYLKNPSDAEDVVQDVFFSLFIYNGSFENEEHLKAWLIRCAINRSKNLLSSAWHRHTVPLELADNALWYDMSENNDEVVQALKKISKKNNIVMYLYYYENYSTKEIADILGISVTAVTSRLKRGRRQLNKIINNNGGVNNGI